MTFPAGLEKFIPVAEGVATLFQPFIEVVIHDLSTETVAFIANDFSKRSPGDPSLMKEIDFSGDEQVIGPYEKVNFDGRKIRSISIVLRDDQQQAIGMMCINMDLSPWIAAKQPLDTLLGQIPLMVQPEKLFKDDWHEQINQYISSWLLQRKTTLDRLSMADRRDLIFELYRHQAFEGRGTTSYVARVLNMGRATVYKYLQEAKKKPE